MKPTDMRFGGKRKGNKRLPILPLVDLSFNNKRHGKVAHTKIRKSDNDAVVQ